MSDKSVTTFLGVTQILHHTRRKKLYPGINILSPNESIEKKEKQLSIETHKKSGRNYED